MDVKQSVQEKFGEAAAHYASSWPHRDGSDLQAMLEVADLSGDEVVLDVGCGAGHAAFAFARGCRNVVALDLTEEMLAQTCEGARERHLDNVETHRGDAESLAFGDASFDVVVSRLAAHHFPHVARFAAEAFRVLRPGGRLIVSDSISPEDETQDTWLNSIEVLRDPSHVRNYRVSEWLTRFRASGFAAAEAHGTTPCPLDVAVWTERMNTPADARAGLRALFASAPADVAEALHLDRDGRSWQLEIAVVSARKA
ncbi:MAG: class I SAM-dependent methyltransferase [Myxococcales bacterium]|nr:class I SAM-dependent methyltransferase [Myxococcales bacterium]